MYRRVCHSIELVLSQIVMCILGNKKTEGRSSMQAHPRRQFKGLLGEVRQAKVKYNLKAL